MFKVIKNEYGNEIQSFMFDYIGEHSALGMGEY